MLGKTAFITGATRGIGKAIAAGFLREGWNVAACGRDTKKLDAICTEEAASRFLPLELDVRDDAAVKKCVAQTVKHFRSIDVLVNNAGIHFPGTLELTPEQMGELLDVNVKAAWTVLRAVVPQMEKQRSGHIFNIASVAGVVGFAGVGGYGATKFALRGMTESLFRELIDKGIKVTAVNPSWVDTDMAAHSPVPPEKMIRPEDIFRTIEFLTTLSAGACVPEITIQCTSDAL